MLGATVLEERTFEWIFLPVGWALTIFIIYGVFGVDITRVTDFGNNENQSYVVKQAPRNTVMNSTERAIWLAKTRQIGMLGLMVFGIQMVFFITGVWIEIAWAQLVEKAAKLIGFVLMLVFLVKIGPDFIQNQRYSSAMKIGLLATIVFFLVLGFFIMYFFLLWYCTKEIRYDVTRSREASVA